MSIATQTTVPPDPVERRVRQNLETVRGRIELAARRAGREPTQIRLIAVSKNQPPDLVAAAVAAGQRDFGENTVQEALPKIEELASRGLNWHFIGTLQTNKAKFIPGRFSCLHSLDRLTLAQRLAQICVRARASIDALIQVNITGEPSKHGVPADGLYALMEQLLDTGLEGLRLRGLMTLAPLVAPPSALHECFARLRKLREGCVQRFGLPSFSELSMGMSGDFEVAIAEGATLVRIGTAIFGPRPTPHD